MPDLLFGIKGVDSVPHAAVPMLAVKLHIANEPAEEPVHNIILRCQVQIEPARRGYTPTEREKLHDLFDDPSRWARTVRPMLWMNTSVSVPAFQGATVADLQLPCTFDFNVAATKYFHALEGGDVPVTVMFNGTVFYADPDGRLQATQIPWDKEAAFRLPVALWQQMMNVHYPNTAWLCLRRDVVERLHEYKVRNALPTFEQVLERLLEQQDESFAPPRVLGEAKR